MTTNRGPNRMEEPQVDVVPGRTPDRPDPKTVADQFTHQYYTVFSNYPRYLYRFYDRSSTMTVSEVLENGRVKSNTAENQEGIHKLVLQLFCDTTVKLGHVLPQFSQNGGIVMQVSGTLLRKGVERSFAQSFFLAVQEKGFYVLNDILHITPMVPATTPRSELVTGDVPVPKPIQPKAPAPPSIDAPRHKPATHESPRPEPVSHRDHAPINANPPVVPKITYAQLLKEGGTTNSQNSARGSVNVPKASEVRVQPPVTPPSPGYSPPSQKVTSNGTYLGPVGSRHMGPVAGFQRNSSVFVRDVPANVDETTLRQVFEQYGGVTNVVIRNGRRDMRFAFVDFANTGAMDECLRHEVSVGGRRLFVEEKKPLVLRNKQQRFRRAGSGSPGPQDNAGNGGNGAFYG